jgi:hypothetical protein
MALNQAYPSFVGVYVKGFPWWLSGSLLGLLCSFSAVMISSCPRTKPADCQRYVRGSHAGDDDGGSRCPENGGRHGARAEHLWSANHHAFDQI